MQLFHEGNANLLSHRAQGSLLSMGVGGVEGVDVTMVAGLRPGRTL